MIYRRETGKSSQNFSRVRSMTFYKRSAFSSPNITREFAYRGLSSAEQITEIADKGAR